MKDWIQFNEGLTNIDKWETKMINFIKKEGATKVNHGGMMRWLIDTKFGNLHIHFDLRDGYPAIFMKFEEPERSKELIDVNKYSGKWNLHVSDMSELYRRFKMRINEVKLTPVEKAVKKYNL